jgi:hypothetical protein
LTTKKFNGWALPSRSEMLQFYCEANFMTQDQQLNRQESGTPDAPNEGPIRVLLVEDSPADARLLCELLETAYPGQYVVEMARGLPHLQQMGPTDDAVTNVILALAEPDAPATAATFVNRVFQLPPPPRFTTRPADIGNGVEDTQGQYFLRVKVTNARFAGLSERSAAPTVKTDTVILSHKDGEPREVARLSEIAAGVPDWLAAERNRVPVYEVCGKSKAEFLCGALDEEYLRTGRSTVPL